MNPKDMTNEQVIIGLSAALRVEINHLNKPDDRVYALNYRRQVEAELLRRLYERDALRKENEELRKDKDYFCTRWNEAVGMLRSVTEILREVTTDTHAVDLRDVRNILENIAQWETHWKELAAKAKESEASHDR